MGVFLFGCAVSQSFTDIAKVSVGRMRPHFLDVVNQISPPSIVLWDTSPTIPALVTRAMYRRPENPSFGTCLIFNVYHALPGFLSPFKVFLARRSSPPPPAAVHPVDDGLLHRPVTRVRPQAPPDRCPGRLCAGSPGGLLH
ncbi:hypothetical protein KUCAC02_023300, partial [Chaenocephalus aceratus]